MHFTQYNRAQQNKQHNLSFRQLISHFRLCLSTKAAQIDQNEHINGYKINIYHAAAAAKISRGKNKHK